MFGIHGPKVTDIISKKIGTKRATSTIPKDPPIQLPRKTTKGCTGPRLHAMSYWPLARGTISDTLTHTDNLDEMHLSSGT